MTDASCWILSQMDPEARHKLLKDAFSTRGMNLTMVRLNCGASDYSTELYNYNDTPGDVEMPKVTKTKDGIQFEVTGLSPISVGWTAPKTSDVPQTGDNTPIVVLAIFMVTSAACLVVLTLNYKKQYAK